MKKTEEQKTDTITNLLVPLITAIMGCGMIFSKSDLFSEFLTGIKEGIQSAVGLLPMLLALLSAISLFNASGASELLSELLSPVFSKLGIPPEISSLVLVRPLSGSASTSLLADIFEKYGADSFPGECASVIAGSSDTLLYIVSVYFGGVGIKKGRETMFFAFLVSFFCVFLSCFLVRSMI